MNGKSINSDERKVRIGVVNWDCSLPSSTFFGYYQTRTLSPKKYRTWTPFYADILGENKIDYHTRAQEEYDRELRYAIDSGIDYFAFVFYPDKEALKESDIGDERWENCVYELNYARLMYESSSLKDKIGMALIIGASDHYERDYKEIARLMQEPHYEKIDGRPIIYLFSHERKYVEGVRRAVEEINGKEPLFFAMISRIPCEGDDFSYVDGISAYACGKSDIDNYCEILEAAISENEGRAGSGKLTVPIFPMGWNPSPRIDIPSPWVKYGNKNYASPATADELMCGGDRFSEWLFEKKKSSKNITDHILTFAWNEFEEGGWICPTYNEDLSINAERVDVFAEIVRRWKKIL